MGISNALARPQLRSLAHSPPALNPGGLRNIEQDLGRSGQRVRHAAGAQIDWAEATKLGTIVSGWASEQRIMPDGQRQIFTFLVPGDCFLVSAKSNLGDRAAVALTSVAIEEEAIAHCSGEVLERILALREGRLLDHIMRLGRQSALERTIHLLLELRDRLCVAGLVKDESFRLPVTQETFAEALGLSLVHVNRTFQQLRREGLIVCRAGAISLLKPKTLVKMCGYERSSTPSIVR